MIEKELTHTFPIDMTSKIDGQRYRGTFTTTKLNIGQIMEMGSIKAQLTGGFSYNPVTGRGIGVMQEQLAEMLAMCQVALILKPKWFDNPLELIDDAILRTVFEEVNGHEASFRPSNTAGDGRKGSEGAEGAGQHSGAGQDGGTVESPKLQPGSIAALVDQKIPDITKVG